MTETPYPCVARNGRPTRVVHIGQAPFGAENFTIIAGPCAIESQTQITAAAALVKGAGAAVLRGGAFKPRTSPYSFQGLGLDGAKMLQTASKTEQIPTVTEVSDTFFVAKMAPLVDAYQVGSRNMQNFALLKALGACDKPVLLKRSFGATLTEWLQAAEYIVSGGNEQVILCERGVRAFGDELRFTLDLAGAVWAKQKSRLPVIVDPSHATGRPELIGPMSRAALAAGLDGLMIEVHPDPAQALCDGRQALTEAEFLALVNDLSPLADAIGRPLWRTTSPRPLLSGV